MFFCVVFFFTRSPFSDKSSGHDDDDDDDDDGNSYGMNPLMMTMKKPMEPMQPPSFLKSSGRLAKLWCLFRANGC